jgi:hypothetical protein
MNPKFKLMLSWWNFSLFNNLLRYVSFACQAFSRFRFLSEGNMTDIEGV